MECSLLSKGFIMLWRIRVFLIYIAAVAVCVVFLRFYKVLCLILIAFLTILLLICLFLYVPAYYKSYCVRYESGKIYIKHGIFFCRNYCIAADGISCIRYITTPLCRLNKCCDCVIYLTAKAVFISGLDEQIKQLSE